MEYKFVELNEWMRDKNGIEFVFLFKTARLLNRGWSDSVHKTIHQEYFIMNEKECDMGNLMVHFRMRIERSSLKPSHPKNNSFHVEQRYCESFFLVG